MSLEMTNSEHDSTTQQTEACSACGGPFHPATGHAWSARLVLCHACTLDWIKWLKAREASMGRPWHGGTTSFTEAALSSIHAL